MHRSSRALALGLLLVAAAGCKTGHALGKTPPPPDILPAHFYGMRNLGVAGKDDDVVLFIQFLFLRDAGGELEFIDDASNSLKITYTRGNPPKQTVVTPAAELLKRTLKHWNEALTDNEGADTRLEVSPVAMKVNGASDRIKRVQVDLIVKVKVGGVESTLTRRGVFATDV